MRSFGLPTSPMNSSIAPALVNCSWISRTAGVSSATGSISPQIALCHGGDSPNANPSRLLVYTPRGAGDGDGVAGGDTAGVLVGVTVAVRVGDTGNGDGVAIRDGRVRSSAKTISATTPTPPIAAS
jgi:hypothetical protein